MFQDNELYRMKDVEKALNLSPFKTRKLLKDIECKKFNNHIKIYKGEILNKRLKERGTMKWS